MAETVDSFIKRMWSATLTQVSAEDMSTLFALALIGAQELIKAKGKDVLIPDAN